MLTNPAPGESLRHRLLQDNHLPLLLFDLSMLQFNLALLLLDLLLLFFDRVDKNCRNLSVVDAFDFAMFVLERE